MIELMVYLIKEMGLLKEGPRGRLRGQGDVLLGTVYINFIVPSKAIEPFLISMSNDLNR